MNENVKVLINALGKNNIIVCQEECAELIQALTKYQRYGIIQDNLYEEIADVLTSVEWVIEYLGLSTKTIERIKQEKIERSQQRYEAGELK